MTELELEKRGLIILHAAFSIGVLLIILLLHVFVKNIDFSTIGNDLLPLEFTALTIAAIALVLANYFFKKKATEIDSDELTLENAGEWRQAYILKWALLEGSCLINTLFYFFVGNNAILAIVAILLLLLLYVSKPRFTNI